MTPNQLDPSVAEAALKEETESKGPQRLVTFSEVPGEVLGGVVVEEIIGDNGEKINIIELSDASRAQRAADGFEGARITVPESAISASEYSAKVTEAGAEVPEQESTQENEVRVELENATAVYEQQVKNLIDELGPLRSEVGKLSSQLQDAESFISSGMIQLSEKASEITAIANNFYDNNDYSDDATRAKLKAFTDTLMSVQNRFKQVAFDLPSISAQKGEIVSSLGGIDNELKVRDEAFKEEVGRIVADHPERTASALSPKVDALEVSKNVSAAAEALATLPEVSEAVVSQLDGASGELGKAISHLENIMGNTYAQIDPSELRAIAEQVTAILQSETLKKPNLASGEIAESVDRLLAVA